MKNPMSSLGSILEFFKEDIPLISENRTVALSQVFAHWGVGGGGEHKAQGTGSDFKHSPDQTVRGTKMTMTQGWTQTTAWQMACHV